MRSRGRSPQCLLSVYLDRRGKGLHGLFMVPEMKFITRELYEIMQPANRVPEEFSQRAWLKATRAKKEYEETLLPRLPQGLLKLREDSMHDGIVADIKVGGDTITVEIDGANFAWNTPSIYRLVFRGVREARGVEEVVDDAWLYEEIDVHPEARFELRVLFEKSELSIAADDLELIRVSHAEDEESNTGLVSLRLVAIRSSDIERAARFYQQLGLEFGKESHGTGQQHLAAALAPEAVFEIYSESTGSGSSAGIHIGFVVDYLDRILEELALPADRVLSPATDTGRFRRAVIRDPDGHVVELNEYRYMGDTDKEVEVSLDDQ